MLVVGSENVHKPGKFNRNHTMDMLVLRATL